MFRVEFLLRNGKSLQVRPNDWSQTLLTCLVNVDLLSKTTPKYLTSLFEGSVFPLILTTLFTLGLLRVNKITSVFYSFGLIFHLLKYLKLLANAMERCLAIVSVLKEEIKNAVSPANMEQLALTFILFRSLINKLKRVGPCTEPWSTPTPIDLKLEQVLTIVT